MMIATQANDTARSRQPDGCIFATDLIQCATAAWYRASWE